MCRGRKCGRAQWLAHLQGSAKPGLRGAQCSSGHPWHGTARLLSSRGAGSPLLKHPPSACSPTVPVIIPHRPAACLLDGRSVAARMLHLFRGPTLWQRAATLYPPWFFSSYVYSNVFRQTYIIKFCLETRASEILVCSLTSFSSLSPNPSPLS